MTLWGAASWWQITSVSGGGGPNERQTAPGGGRKPYWASWNIRSICATVVSASSVTQCGAKGYSPHSPSRNDSTSRPRSSMPRARGAPVKPTYSRWRSRAWTAGVQGPALRRTVSPFRTTKEVFPPWSGISCCVTPALSIRRHLYRVVSFCGRRTGVVHGTLRVAANQSVDELGRVERRQVVGALPEADQLDRDAELALDRDHDAALGGAVQLGQDHPGHVDHLGKDPGLLKAVLAGGRIEDEQRLVHRSVLLHHPLDLAELVHEAHLVLQAAGRVDQDGVSVGLDASPDRVERHRRRVGPLAAADHLRADPTGPGRELVNRRGAEGVGGTQHDGTAVSHQD